MMRTFIICAVLFGCAFATPFSGHGKITNGENAQRNQFPYQISMQWGLIGIFQHICGGSIIAPNIILTAAHCITETPSIGSFRIAAGLLQLDDPANTIQIINVRSSVTHPEYQGGVNPNDIAILRLASNLAFGESVAKIALPSTGSIPTGVGILSGWGSTSTTDTPIMPNILQTADMPIISLQECANALTNVMGTTGPLAHNNVCTGPLIGGISACSGDSGGPLAQNGEVIGVVSWGIMPCGTEGAPSVFTRTSAFIDFIEANL